MSEEAGRGGPPARPGLEPLEESFERVLCIAAHPDDLEYGTAAAVHRWTEQGKTVTYLLVTRGEAGIDTMAPAEAGPVREQEERDGAAVVGVDVVDFLEGYLDGVVEPTLALRRDLCRELRRLRPDVVVTGSHELRFRPGMSNQADHRAVGTSVLDAAKDCGNRWIFPELVAEGYEPWTGLDAVLVGGSPHPTHFLDVTGHLEPAIASLEAHQAYNDALPDDFPKPRELVTMILSMGAQAAGTEHALLFEVFGN